MVGEVMGLKLVESETSLIDAAFAIAEERENTTQRLAYAVLEKDYETATKLAKELLPNVESYRTHSRIDRSASR